MKKLSQKSKLVKFLATNATLTREQAEKKFGVTKLSARVRELRLSGLQIENTRTRRGVFAYKLVPGIGVYAPA